MDLEKVKKKLLNHIEINEKGCWLWKMACSNRNYGVIRVNGKNLYSHRISWQVFNGNIPKGLCVLHKCDVRNCVNPNHLFLGTDKDNVDDMDRKGRRVNKPSFGQNHPNAKLTNEKVKKIKLLIEEGVSQREIAHRFSISQTAVCSINNKRTWENV